MYDQNRTHNVQEALEWKTAALDGNSEREKKTIICDSLGFRNIIRYSLISLYIAIVYNKPNSSESNNIEIPMNNTHTHPFDTSISNAICNIAYFSWKT